MRFMTDTLDRIEVVEGDITNLEADAMECERLSGDHVFIEWKTARTTDWAACKLPRKLRRGPVWRRLRSKYVLPVPIPSGPSFLQTATDTPSVLWASTSCMTSTVIRAKRETLLVAPNTQDVLKSCMPSYLTGR